MHTTGNCYSLKQIEKARCAKEAGGGNQHKDRTKDQDQHKGDGFGRSTGSLHTFTGVGDRRDRKVLTRAVDRLGMLDSRLENTKVTFHGIIPRRKAFPIGKVTLPVTFGTPVNYHTDRITFEVVNFRSPYHCVLGRQAFARFMVAPHYAYNMMKMPGPRGVITVRGDPEMALECEDSSAKLADAVIAEEHDNIVELAKNAGATYQRCMNSCMESQIGRNVHVYIDDVVVKSTRQDDLVIDLAETFANLRRYQIKLNPLKCTFGVPSGQLLGYLVSKRGIEPNPEKTFAVIRTKQPACLVDAQKLAGQVVALSRFIPRLGDKATPLYRLLNKSESFEWTDEAQKALEELQHALRNAPVLVAPLPQETMLLYVAASNRAISTVMVVERQDEGKEQLIQRPVHYISEALIESKQRYPHYQKLVYAVLRAQRRLAPYFHEHPIKVVASTPLADIIRNRDATGRIAKWAVELGVHNITYESRHAIKSQALADFLADWEEAQQLSSPADLKHWTLQFDGSKNHEGAGVVLTSPKGDIVRYVLQLRFEPCTNNMAEYEALLHGMRIAKEMGATRLRCLGDSDLVASQTSGTCDATDANMIAYKQAVDQAGASFAGHVVEWVDRRKNEEADTLARLGSKRLQPPPGVFLDILSRSSVRAPREIDIAEPPAPDSALVALASDADDWTEPYLGYLECQVLSMDETEARALVRRCKSFTIINNELYKRSTSGVFQRCIAAGEGRKILCDIHESDCGHHAAHEDAVDLVRACAGCQKYASQSHMSGSALKTIPLTWRFAVWGMDMVGKFKTAPGGYTHLLVDVDKFTKWVEAKPIKKCDGKTATKFLRELIYRYVYPHSIITDDGTNFAKGEMADFCEDKGI
ncbi:uncharacterized protein [Lolium perenne]|uniref:uncharacterized protein n=1 Tax=Lolium perenne TaxID=4522 RepID=UPI0021F5D123|nr:uncharacterized protein LOC127330988 [Lolium perenne]